MTEIKYSSFATPPYEIRLNKVYSFGKDSKGYFFADKKNKVYADLAEIKMLFTPVDKTWDEVLKTPKVAEKKEN